MTKDIAVVTGASGGIGRAIAKRIHEKSEGTLRLALHYHGNQQAAERLRSEIPDSFLVKADLTSQGGRQMLLAAALKEGTPYVLVNNAGIDSPHEPALNIQEESFDKIISTNLKAPFFLMRDFGREMARAEGGIIVNVSSILARKALVGSAIYRASKAALEAATKQFASELGPRGVRVSAVTPGFIETPMTNGLSQELKEEMRAEIALGRFGAPAAVAEAVCQLIENDYINGAVLAVDGGMSL
ncbi:MAG: SDR family oxidoreductase [Elusimicrobia bacterium]|nr:SDR family oxidoreductase [Elusimicrobiota bacterium]